MSSPVIDNTTRRLIRLSHGAGLLITVACGAMAYEMLYVPVRNESRELADEVMELRALLDNSPLARQEHSRLSERIASTKEQITQLRQRVPDLANEAHFLQELSEIAQQEEFSVSNFRPAKVTNRDGYAEMEITLTGTGSYRSICTFFDRLANSPRLSKVKNLDIGVDEIDEEYSVSATLLVFFGLSPAEAPAKEVARG